MSEPFIGEIRLFPYSFAPVGWNDCDGRMLAIANNEALFSLIGTTYGGDGQTTFALPDLRGRVPLHQGQGPGMTQRVPGEQGGLEAVALSTLHLPTHSHAFTATSDRAAATTPAADNQPGALVDDTFYTGDVSGLNSFVMAPTVLDASGDGQPHDNLMPTLAVRFCMAIAGLYPSRN